MNIGEWCMFISEGADGQDHFVHIIPDARHIPGHAKNDTAPAVPAAGTISPSPSGNDDEFLQDISAAGAQQRSLRATRPATPSPALAPPAEPVARPGGTPHFLLSPALRADSEDEGMGSPAVERDAKLQRTEP